MSIGLKTHASLLFKKAEAIGRTACSAAPQSLPKDKVVFGFVFMLPVSFFGHIYRAHK